MNHRRQRVVFGQQEEEEPSLAFSWGMRLLAGVALLAFGGALAVVLLRPLESPESVAPHTIFEEPAVSSGRAVGFKKSLPAVAAPAPNVLVDPDGSHPSPAPVAAATRLDFLTPGTASEAIPHLVGGLEWPEATDPSSRFVVPRAAALADNERSPQMRPRFNHPSEGEFGGGERGHDDPIRGPAGSRPPLSPPVNTFVAANPSLPGAPTMPAAGFATGGTLSPFLPVSPAAPITSTIVAGRGDRHFHPMEHAAPNGSGTVPHAAYTFDTLVVDAGQGNSPFTLNPGDTLGTNQTEIGLAGSVGVLNQGGGTHTVNNTLSVGFGAGGIGVYNLSGGSVTAPTILVGSGPASNGSIAQSAGSVTSSVALTLAPGSGSAGTYGLSGGSLTASGSVTIGSVGTGQFTQSGGMFLTKGAIFLGGNAGSRGTYNLNGGLLLALSVSPGPNATGSSATPSPVSTLNFNGGTLRAAGDSPAFVAGLTAANVQAGGALIDSQNSTMGISQVLSHDPALGNTPDGGLTKLGPGTLSLTGANTYTGLTTVSAGALRVNNVAGSGTGTGAVQINPGGTLGGTGFIAGGVTAGTGLVGGTRGVIDPGTPGQAVATLTVGGAVSFTANSAFLLELDATAVGAASKLLALGVTIDPAAAFILNDGRTTPEPVGTALTIIDNTAATPIAGVFANLSDGATVRFGVDTFRVNYEGGTGNDLVLTSVVPEPGSPVGCVVAGLVALGGAAVGNKYRGRSS